MLCFAVVVSFFILIKVYHIITRNARTNLKTDGKILYKILCAVLCNLMKCFWNSDGFKIAALLRLNAAKNKRLSAAAVVTLGKAEAIGQKVRICSASVLFGFWCIANKTPMIKEYLRRRCFVIMWRGYFPLFAGFVFAQRSKYICSNYAAYYPVRLIGKRIVKPP